MSIERVEKKFGRQSLIIETGKIAKQASGSVTVQYGGTVVLVTACMSKKPKEGVDFLPLTVEYQEKTYAAGRIPGGFFKREGRPSTKEILSARLIDRPTRPLFPKGLSNEIQIMSLVLSSDAEFDPDILSVIGASAALSISEIPFSGPLSACRVARIDGEFILNPSYEEREKADLDIVVAATEKGILMLEGKAKEVEEENILEAIKFGYEALGDVTELQKELVKKCGKSKTEVELKSIDPELLKKVKELSAEKLSKFCQMPQEEREQSLDALYNELINQIIPEGAQGDSEICQEDIKSALDEIEKEEVRKFLLSSDKRVDGRDYSQIREITCEVGVLPRTHGSGLFTRGQTQSLAVTTLGTRSDEQMIEALEGESYKSFMLHYTFPPFSVGETRPVRGPGRREIGHGALAEKALAAVMPSKDDFPYTVRVVSEILESNGSSSMATVCASALCLMDAGVPIKDAVAGIAIGLIKDEDKFVVFTDISGLEDHFGDMDFKLAGTKKGVTALQMDLKIDGIGFDILSEATQQAHKAKSVILENMNSAIAKPRKSISNLAPRITILKISTEKIGELIGPGGKTIKKIIATTGATIDIEDDGRVLVSSVEAKASEEAIKMIRSLTEDVEVGTVFLAKVKRVVAFGAFCEIAPGKEGLVHVSELADKFVKNVEDILKVGDEIKVKVIGIDDLGRIKLSKKQAECDEKSNNT